MFSDLFDVYIKNTESCGCFVAEMRTVISLEDMEGHSTLVVVVRDETVELSCSCQLVS